MAKYLISFPRAAMVVPDGEWEAVGRDAHAVIDEEKPRQTQSSAVSVAEPLRHPRHRPDGLQGLPHCNTAGASRCQPPD